MNLALIVAIISPFIFGLVNIFDKFVLSHKIKDSLSYSAVSGLIPTFLGIIIACFLKWDNITLNSLLFPILAGIISGVAYYLYFFIMKNSDASYFIGFLFLYPLVVIILSLIFLKESLTLFSCLSILLIFTGVTLLSIRAKKMKMSLLIVPLTVYIILIGCYEFFIKVSTDNLPFMNGLAIDTMTLGLVVLCGLFNARVRKNFIKELKNIKLAFIGEVITLLGVLTIFFSMSRLPATLVSPIAATQPLAVLIFERIAHSRFGKITKDVKLLPKLVPILLIVLGVVLLSIFAGV